MTAEDPRFLREHSRIPFALDLQPHLRTLVTASVRPNISLLKRLQIVLTIAAAGAHA